MAADRRKCGDAKEWTARLRMAAALLFALVAGNALLLPATVFAQVSSPEPPVTAADSGGVSGLPGKYARWKKHRGSPQEAIAVVRVTTRDPATGKNRTQTGNGFVIRCDGFVLAPASLFAGFTPNPSVLFSTAQKRMAEAGQKIEVRFATVDGEENVTMPVDALPPRFLKRSVPFVLVKTTDIHVPGVALLEAQNAREGRKVEVTYAEEPAAPNSGAAGADTAFARTRKRTAVIGERQDKRGKFYALRLRDNGGSSGGDSIPVGAVVTDPVSGAAIGLVDSESATSGDTTAALRLATFADFYEISNEVALLPIPPVPPKADTPVATAPPSDVVDQSQQIRRVSPAATGETDAYDNRSMVLVPGGPIRLTPGLRGEYERAYGTNVACMADFWIDAFPVTNTAYREYLLSVRAAVSETASRPDFPVGWLFPTEMDNPVRRQDLPVDGVSIEQAYRFALWNNQRLVTPVEWAKAQTGAFGSWVQDYDRLLAEFSDTLKTISIQLFRLLETQKRERQLQGLRDQPGAAYLFPPSAYISSEQNQLINEFFARHWYPGFVPPVGFYQDDRSIYGVRDVITGLVELCVTNFSQRREEEFGKGRVARIDPYLLKVTVSSQGAYSMDFLTDFARRGSPGYKPPGAETIYSWFRGDMRLTGTTLHGFRCAF